MRGVVLLALLILCGCDAVVGERVVGPSRVERRSESCTYFSYCYTCMPGIEGKMECGFKASAFCSGEHDVQVRITPVELRFKSGPGGDERSGYI